MNQQDINVILQDYKLSLDLLSALGFIVANKDRAIGLFTADFYRECEDRFRNAHID